MAKKIEIDIIANDQASAVYKKVVRSTASMATNINNSLLDMNSALRRYNIAMWDFNRVASRVFTLAGRSVYNFTADAINNFTLLEQQHAKTMGAMANNYDKTNEAQKQFMKDQQALRDSAIKLGTVGPNGNGSLYNPQEVSYAQTSLVKAGKKPEEILNSGSVETILKFAGGNDLSIDDATQFAVNLGTQFEIPMKDWAKMLDQVTRTADTSVIDVEDIIESIKYAGGISSGLGRPLDEVLASIGVMGNAGLRGSMAGTGIQQFYTRILSPVGKSQAVLDKAPGIAGDVMEAFLAETTYTDPTTGGQKFKDMSEVTDLLDKSMNMLDDKEQAWFAQKLFGLFQMKAGYALARPTPTGGNAIEDFQNDIKSNSSGTVDKKYYYMMESQYGSIKAMQNAWTGVKTDIGGKMSPVVNAIADEIFEFITKNGDYDIDFSKIREAVYETGGSISESYGRELGTLVTNLGTMGIDASAVLKAISPTLIGGTTAAFDLLSGHPIQALQDLGDALDKTKDNIDELPPYLQDLANNANSAALALFAIAGANVATKIIETITTLWKYTGGKIITQMANLKSTKTDIDSAVTNAKTTTMNVTASVVNVYGGANPGGGASSGGSSGSGKGKLPTTPTPKALPGGTGASSAAAIGGSLLKGSLIAGALLSVGMVVDKLATDKVAFNYGAGNYKEIAPGMPIIDSSANDVISKYPVPESYKKKLKNYTKNTKTFDDWSEGSSMLEGAGARYYASRKSFGVTVSDAEYMAFIKQYAEQIRGSLSGRNPNKFTDVSKLPDYDKLNNWVTNHTSLPTSNPGISSVQLQPKINVTPKIDIKVNIDKDGKANITQSVIPDASWINDYYHKQSSRNGQ